MKSSFSLRVSTRVTRALFCFSLVSVIVFGGFFIPLSAHALTTLSVTSPNGGEEWRGTQSISWSSTGGVFGDTVNIVYSTDNFFSQAVVATGVPYNSTPFSWNTTLFPESATYKIRFISNSMFVYDTSDAAFMVDNTAPSTALATTTGTLGLDGWYKGPSAPTFNLNCTDSLSGCFDTYYSWDAGAFVLSGTITALEGAHTLNWYSRDHATDALGARNIETTHSQVIKVDTIDPTVAVTSTTVNGAYNEPDAINVTLTFSEAVTTTDTITVTIETGATDRTCIVPIMINSSVGTCTYTVQAGDTSGDLNTNSIIATTGTVLDIAGNTANLTPTSNLAATSAIVIDTTAPSAFTTGTSVTTGGTVVATWWNSTNTGLDVTVPVANDASLTGGTIQLQAEADGTFANIGNAYTIAGVDLNTNKTLSLTATQVEALSGFSEGDTLTFRAVITDLATNSTTGSNSIDIFVVDQTLPSTDAGTDKEVNAVVSQDATTSDGGSGLSIHSWTQFSGPGALTFGTSSAVDTTILASLDGVYIALLTVTDVAGNSASDDISFAWDTTAPTLAEVTPVPTPTNDTTPNYTFSVSSVKQLPASGGGGITYGGTCSSATTNAVAGNNTVTFNSLANAVHNTCTIAVTDAAGNLSSTLSITAFEVDTIVATVSSITTTDANLDGKVDTATIVFSDEVKDSTFSAGTFTIGGTTVTSVGTGGTANDNTIVLTVSGGVAGTNAKLVVYTPGTATDLAGNALGAISQTSTDAAKPVLLSARTITITSIEAMFSEDLNVGTVNGSGNEFTVAGVLATAAVEHGANDGRVVLTVATMGTGATPSVKYAQVDTLNDLAAVPNTAVTPTTVTAVDGVAPTLSSVIISSNNDADFSAPEWAKVGDIATLSFTASETIATPVITIDGMSATTVTSPSVNNWVATYTFVGGEADGTIPFSIAFADLSAPTPNIGTTVMVTGDSSSVFFDEVAPTVNAGTNKEVNAVVSQDATVSDLAPSSAIATYAWTNQTPGVGTITFGTPTAEDTNISASADGTYTIRLTVTDNAGNSAFDELTFIWDTTNPEPLTSSPSDGATGVAIAGGTATVTYDEPIILLDSSRVLLVDDVTGTSYKGTVVVSGINPRVLNIAYSGLNYGTKYRINVKAGNPITGVGASVRDVAGNWVNTSWTSYFTTVIDTIVPVVNSASAGSITTTGATLSVTTNESSTCRYATTDSAYSGMTAFTTTGSTSHSVALSGLSPSTGYSFFVRCADTSAQANTMTVSAHVSFTTSAPAADTTAPGVPIITTAPATIDANAYTIAGTAGADTPTDGTRTVRLYNGATLVDTLSLPAGQTTWASNVSLTQNSANVFTATSQDVAGNTSVASASVTITEATATGDTTAPAVPAITTTPVTVDSNTYTIIGTAGADLPTDGSRTITITRTVGAVTTVVGSLVLPIGETDWSFSAPLSQNAANVFTAVSTDVAGNTSAPSTSVTITETTAADTTAPATPVITTLATTIDANIITISGTAGADLPTDGVRTITISRNGTVVGSLTLAAGVTSWSFITSLVQSTTNTFSAVSTDTAGNSSVASAAVVITEAEGAASLVVTGIGAVANENGSTGFSTPNNSFDDGWRWVFNVTVPTSETNFAMKFDNFLSGSNTIGAATNIRYYTAQSSAHSASTTAVTIAGAGTYPGNITLDGDLDADTAGRQIAVTVEVRVPIGSAGGSYSANYGVKSGI